MVQRSYRALLWTLAIAGLALDLGSKYAVFAVMYQDGRGSETAIIPGAFDLLTQFTGAREAGEGTLATLRTLGGDALPRVNHGALFGMASEHVHLANGVFAVISFLAAAGIIFWSFHPTLAGDWFLCTALGLILGGTLGNLYDRVVFGGVRDFLHWHYAFEWPVFNIADCCLVVGAGLLLAQALFQKPPAPAEKPIDQPAEAQPVA